MAWQKRPVDALNCFRCGHFCAFKKRKSNSHKINPPPIRVSTSLFYLFFLEGFVYTLLSDDHSGAEKPRRTSNKSPRTCECAHVLRPPASSAEPRRCRECAAVWLRAPWGSAGGKRMCLLQHFCALYNVQFVALIEPSRPIQIAALCSLPQSPGLN